MFSWQTKKERIIRGLRISARKKLEGLRLINELADLALSKPQKVTRRQLRDKGF